MKTRLLAITTLVFLFQDYPVKVASDIDPMCKKADVAFNNAIRIADDLCLKSKREAAAARLKVYRSQLSEITKSGDFDKAPAIKS